MLLAYKTMKKSLIIILLSLFYLHPMQSQNIHLYGMGKYGAGGLSSFLINKLAQDSSGFIWIATDYGLNKFDGYRYKQYFKSDTETSSLLSNNVRTIEVDSHDRLWVGCDNGLQYYNKQTDGFKTIIFPKQEPIHIEHIIELNSGEIWVIANKKIYVIDKNAHKAIYLDSLHKQISSTLITYIYQDKNSNIWISTADKGLVKFIPSSKEISRYSYPNITCMTENKKGDLYMAISPAIYIYDDISQEFKQINKNYSLPLNILKIITDRSGNIYIATNGQGIKYMKPNDNQVYSFINYSDNIDYSTIIIPDLLQDKDENLWLGCFLKGILMIPSRPDQFNFIKVINTEKHLANTIKSVFRDSNGNIWCGVDNAGLYRFDKKGKLISLFTDIKNATYIFEDSETNLWVAIYNKLNKVNKTTGHCTPVALPLAGYFKIIEEDHNKDFYISSFGSGLIHYNPRTGAWKQYTTEKTTLKNDWINSIITDKDGDVWLGHYEGVTRFVPSQDKFINIEDKELSSQICLSLMSDEDGNIYIGTYNGLFVFNKQTGKLTKYDEKKGLSSNVICFLAKGNNGNIWCSTFNGINQIKNDGHIISYYSGDGLIDRIYTRGVGYQSNDNTILLGSNNGITSFNPSNIKSSDYKHRIQITGLLVRNQLRNINLQNSNKFNFTYEDNNITFEFSTMDFSDVENIHYEYRLKGIDIGWNTTLSGVNQITYNHLNPGSYILEVKACKGGIYSPVKEIFIVIDSPWYKTIPAYLVYILLIILFSILIIKLIQKKQKESINNLKFEYFINISHEIRSPLSLIISPIHKLLKENSDDKIHKILKGVLRNTNRISSLVDQLLDIRKLEEGKIKLSYSKTEMIFFIKELLSIFQEESIKRNISIEFQYTDKDLYAWIDRSNFDKILLNLLSNAFKYTPDNGKILITLTSDSKYFEINVIDSGIGFNENNKNRLFERFFQEKHSGIANSGYGIGLNLSKMLVELHHGIITANNRADAQGSCFNIRIPLGKKHLKKEDVNINPNTSERLILQQNIIQTKTNDSGIYKRRKTDFKVLIIDDDKDIRDFLEEELKEIYKVLIAEDGAEGLKITLSERPDIIVSDVIMPNMDGLTLVTNIRNNANVSHIPIILLTSKTEQISRVQGLKDGADIYLTKPFNIEELHVVIHNLIKVRKTIKEKFSGAQDQNDRINPVELKSNNDKLMERIMVIINEHIGNPDFSVEMLATEAAISRAQLHRKMKEITGLSCGDFIRNIRLKQAEILLKDRSQNITQIAYSLGFSNQAHFSASFKKYYGVSPTEYRERK